MSRLPGKAVLGVLTAAVLASFSAASLPADAQGQPKTVIELFTSQGCSSCPPADKLLGKLAKRGDIIALTLPVDYWDYLGWKDTLARPAYSARQRAYAKTRGDGQVYTPQAVIDGVYHVVGSQASSIERAISKSKEKFKNARVPLSAQTIGDSLVITVGAAPGDMRVKPATIWLALVKKSKQVKISRGENRGQTIIYHQVVRSLTPVGQWRGQEVTIRLPKNHLQSKENDGCTILLQQDTAGPILAAVELKNW